MKGMIRAAGAQPAAAPNMEARTMRFRIPTALIAGGAALLALFVVTAPQPANAGGVYSHRHVGVHTPYRHQYRGRYYHNRHVYPRRHYYHYPRYGYYPRVYRHHHYNPGAAVALGVMGAVVGSAIANSGANAGWVGTPAWYEYCARKYRSFDPRSGTYMTYRGVRVACR